MAGNTTRAASPQKDAARKAPATQRQQQQHQSKYTRSSSPTPSVYLPPRPVALAARIGGVAMMLAQLAVEAPEDTDLRKHLEREAFAVAALAGSEAAA